MKSKTRSKQRSKTKRKHVRRDERDRAILYDRRVAFARVLAEPTHAGKGWYFAHEAGAPVVVGNTVTVGANTLAFPLPLPSELLLQIAEPHLVLATKLRRTVLETAHTLNDLYPDHKSVSNHDLLFNFLQEAMAGVSLVYAALNNFANEHIPREFEMELHGDLLDRDALIRRGIELRLSRVLAEATGEPNLKEHKTEIWQQILHLKDLRDAIEHADGGMEALKTGPDVQSTIFAKLLNEEDYTALAAHVRNVIDMYRMGEEGPTTIDSGGHSVTLMSARRYNELTVSG